MGKNKPVALSWDVFQSMGDPTNPEVKDILKEEEQVAETNYGTKVRVYLERKGRGGKTVTLVKGTELSGPALKDLAKKLKSHCGVGGKVEDDNIMIQGDQRKKAIPFLLSAGFKDVKNAGA